MKAPGKSYRKGITITELMEMFPDERTAEDWFEKQRWPDGPVCPECGSMEHIHANHKTMRYRCKETRCRQFFSVRKGSMMESSNITLRNWAIAIFMVATGLKGVSSLRLHRDLGITQKSAWFMLQRIRESFETGHLVLSGEVEIDETYIGGKKKKEIRGRGPVGKAPVVGAKQRKGKVVVKPVKRTTGKALTEFVEDTIHPDSTVYTDNYRGYWALRKEFNHQVVRHSVSEYVRNQAHTNGIESFWALLKRGYHGTHHHFSVKHLDRYVQEFAGRYNIREMDTDVQMSTIVKNMDGKRLRYEDLIA